jgi:hypothetical protein
MPRVLIERGADLAVQVKDGWTSLHLASYWGQVGVARMLIEHGADLGARIVGCTIWIKEDSTRAQSLVWGVDPSEPGMNLLWGNIIVGREKEKSKGQGLHTPFEDDNMTEAYYYLVISINSFSVPFFTVGIRPLDPTFTPYSQRELRFNLAHRARFAYASCVGYTWCVTTCLLLDKRKLTVR